GITQGQALQKSGQPRRHRHPRKVIIAKGWMARMTRDQHFFVRLTLDPKFTISQMSGMQTGIDVNVVFSLFQLIELMLSQAETQFFLIVRSSIGYPVCSFRNGEKMRSKFRQRHRAADRQTIVQDMEI